VTAAILATRILHQTIGTTGWIGVAVVLIALLITASGDHSLVEPATDPPRLVDIRAPS
jgi:drug/metabolite transporter (DMT)-like permease